MNWQHTNYGAMNGYAAYPDYQHHQGRDSVGGRVATQTNVPQSPTSSAGVEDEEFIRNTTKQPDPSCHVFDGRIYGLKVVQQPNRARMCGFGDKDRRPISAPPIVQLIILDEETKREIDYTSNTLELSHFVCQVDIYSRDGSSPKNLLRSMSNQGSISMTTTSDFPVTPVARPPEVHAQRLSVTDAAHRIVHGPYVSPYDQTIPQNGYANYPSGPYPYPNGYANGAVSNGNGNNNAVFPPSYGPPRNAEPYASYPAPNPYENNSRHQPSLSGAHTIYQPQRTASTSSYAGPSHSVYASQGSIQANGFSDPAQAMQTNFQPRGGAPPTPPADTPTNPTSNTNTNANSNGTGSTVKVDRNLIGTLCTSAVLLKDLDDKDGIFFIWGDLSVRTEDWFSLKFSFFNVGEVLRDATFSELAAQARAKRTFPSELAKEGTNKREKSLNGIRAPLIAKTAPCLATVFSQCFKVFSAKKFPGVVESTKLNAHFAKQGVKITVRSEKDSNDKNNPNGKRKRDGDEDDEED